MEYMSKVVYLVGHGRVSANVVTIMPMRMTMHWLGHLGDVSNGISYAFLLGTLNDEINNSGPRTEINEHHLCGEAADIDTVTDAKIKNFFDRKTPHPLGDTDPYVLYPRGKTNVSLSSIFRFLKALDSTEEWHLYWTCCRGYIGQKNPMTSMFNKSTLRVEQKLRVNPAETPQLRDQDHQIVNADFNNIRMIARSDRSRIDQETVRGMVKKRVMYPRQLTSAIETLLVRV
jgi:hypothetical protein